MTAPTTPWAPGWRDPTWDAVTQPWDLVIIGGGITGAGILALAARMGLRVLLVEQGDFASGTSSRSSKLVHGGLRYLKHVQFRLTWESVHERQRLLNAAPGLVTPLNFIYPIYEGDSPGARTIEMGLGLYTRMARSAGSYRELAPVDLLMVAPGLHQRRLQRGYRYGDAQTDDARLVLRVIQDALLAAEGRAAALNYARVVGLIHRNGRVAGVQVVEATRDRQVEVPAGLVVNATGAWAGQWGPKEGPASLKAPRLRPLRGSHLYFRSDRFPVYQAVSMQHPEDGRPVFALPWEGVTLLGTTDVDHGEPLDHEPTISAAEADYLLAAAQAFFPAFELAPADVLSTQAGVRPVIDTGKENPSEESRDHVVWEDEGLLSVTGGKLTTFRVVALDVLRAAVDLKPGFPKPPDDLPVLTPRIGPPTSVRRRDRHAAQPQDIQPSGAGPLPLPGAPYDWFELVWSARHEAVVHLDDLLLRRFRLGILLPDGGQSLLPQLRSAIQADLGWDDGRWLVEAERYRQIWRQAHGKPTGWF